MRGVKLDAVHARHLCHKRGFHELFNHCFAFFGGHCSGHFSHNRARDRAGGNDFSRLLHGSGDLTAGMVELKEDLRVVLVDSIGQLLKSLHVLGLSRVKLEVSCPTALFIHAGNFCVDQSTAAFGSLLIVPDDLGGRGAVCICEAAPHGRHDDPVFQLQGSDLAS